MTDEAEFMARTDPFRRELLVHCYRMLGSIHDAEDLVQDTYLRAWRAFDRFEERSSLRLWLYKIATRVCLTALETRGRRPLPSGLAAPTEDHRAPLAPAEPAVAWLQPIPDALFDDPAGVVTTRTGVRLAFIAALQYLPARQRAVLILRDVLDLRAAEVAGVLGTTTIAVNSALRRARAQLEVAGPVEDELAEPVEPGTLALLGRYVEAFERGDVAALVELMRVDVELEMPPIPTWFTGRDAVAGFFATRVLHGHQGWRMIPTRANGAAAVIACERGSGGDYDGHGIHVLTELGGRIARIQAFLDPGLIPVFRPFILSDLQCKGAGLCH
jgi:RNA polymerase sigma-70 factor (TIGR02960 family)